ncbi:aromatic acid exporter family protein [Bacillus sp. HMF5848]|uniref:FUSC family protein n=1 Tax=Bacillus sp. HMF5848 TaxID=2495421 RepID=UPI000F7B7151|nr:aromatic acid exporter family protein [Bacillus sp. HMF5848]RSK26367.1 aromatic acid exporter family protein [Bacillus sp. HMF5848]
MTLGPRVVKTGIAVTLALYICLYFDLTPAVFAGIAAIFTIQPSIYRTWRQVLDQLKTNTLGALIALLALFAFGNEPIAVGVVMILVILVSLQLKMESTISLTLVTVLAIMSAPAHEEWFFAANRFLIILIGMLSASLVNLFVLPPKYSITYFQQTQSAFQNLSLLMRTAISDELTEKSFRSYKKKLEKDVNKLDELFNMLNEEREKLSKVKPLNARELVIFKQMLLSTKHGIEVLDVIEDHYFQSNPQDGEKERYDQHLEYLIKCHEHLLLKYEGKIKDRDEYLEDTMVEKSAQFLEQIMQQYDVEKEETLRLVVIGSSIFEYALKLERLNDLIEKYLKSKSAEKSELAQ